VKRFVLMLVLDVCLGLAQAATIQLDGQTATGVAGLIVDGQVYDVSFEIGSFQDLNIGDAFPFLDDQTLAIQSRDSILALLNETDALYIAEFPSNHFWVPYDVDATRAYSEVSVFNLNQWVSGGGNAGLDESIPGYAIFSAVPIPAAFWLFGSALGLLGWMRKGKLLASQ
jgi:hypothetical protein